MRQCPKQSRLPSQKYSDRFTRVGASVVVVAVAASDARNAACSSAIPRMKPYTFHPSQSHYRTPTGGPLAAPAPVPPVFTGKGGGTGGVVLVDVGVVAVVAAVAVGEGGGEDGEEEKEGLHGRAERELSWIR